jgi:hypothetical protein
LICVETLFLTLREQPTTFRTFENKVLRNIFGSKKQEAEENYIIRSFMISPNTINVIK